MAQSMKQTKKVITQIPVPHGFRHDGVRPSKRQFTYLENLNRPKKAGENGRGYQKKGIDKLKGHACTIYIAPTGSGKTIVQNTLAGMDLLNTKFARKQLFIAPQRNIGNNFTMEYIDRDGVKQFGKLDINGQAYEWKITENYCEDVSKQSEENIRAFLLGAKPSTTIINRMMSAKILEHGLAVCCYPTLIAVWRKLTDSEKNFVAKHTAIRIDEVHHLRLNGDSDESCNLLGRTIKDFISRRGHVHCTTATMFRGDRHSIFFNLDTTKFAKFKVDWMEFWKSTGIDRLHMFFEAYEDGQSLFNLLDKRVRSEKNQKHIIIVPSDQKGIFRKLDKQTWVSKLVRKMKSIYGSNRVLDLVYNQDQDKKRLLSENKDFDCVVTCMIGREGTDWPACSRVHNLVLDRNVLQPIQKLGRATRRYDKKHQIKMTTYIEHFSNWEDEEDGDVLKDKFTDYFNAILAMSIYDDLFYPIKLPVIRPTEKDEEDDDDFGGDDRHHHEDDESINLQDVYDTEKYHDIKTQVYEAVAAATADEDKDPETVRQAIKDVVVKFKKDMLIKVPIAELVAAFAIDVARRMNPKNKSLRAEIDGYASTWIRKHGFATIVRKHIHGGSYFEGTASTKLMQKMALFFKAEHDRFSEHKLVDFLKMYVNTFYDIFERKPSTKELKQIINMLNEYAKDKKKIPSHSDEIRDLISAIGNRKKESKVR